MITLIIIMKILQHRQFKKNKVKKYDCSPMKQESDLSKIYDFTQVGTWKY